MMAGQKTAGFHIYAAALIVGLVFPFSVHAETIIKVGGVGSALGTIKLLAKAYEKRERDVRVVILPSLGSSGGIKALAEGAIDFSLSSRPLKDGEDKNGMEAVEYARSPFVFVTYKGNKISNITERDLSDILSGQRSTWDDGLMIRVVYRPEGETNTAIVRAISPQVDAAMQGALKKPGIIIAVSDQENTEMLRKVHGCFGFSTLTDLVDDKGALKILSFNGMMPTVKALAEGKYPVYKRFFVVSSASTSSQGKKFIDFILSPAGGEIVSSSGNVVIRGR